MMVMATASRYLVIVEAGSESYAAYVPDLPGCVAAADTREEVEALIREGVVLYLEALRERDEPVPAPTTSALKVVVPPPDR
jgi:predicted RNase H-like HicB family nuclease